MSPSGEPVYMPGDLGFMSAAQGIPLDHLVLLPLMACVHGSSGTNNKWKNSSWLAATPRAECRDRRIKHIPSLYVKEAYLLVLKIWP